MLNEEKLGEKKTKKMKWRGVSFYTRNYDLEIWMNNKCLDVKCVHLYLQPSCVENILIYLQPAYVKHGESKTLSFCISWKSQNQYFATLLHDKIEFVFVQTTKSRFQYANGKSFFSNNKKLCLVINLTWEKHLEIIFITYLMPIMSGCKNISILVFAIFYFLYIFMLEVLASVSQYRDKKITRINISEHVSTISSYELWYDIESI